MSRKIIAFVVLAVAFAAVFVRLGFWQLERLGERRASNAGLVASLAQPPVLIQQLEPGARARRAIVEGTPDYDNEFVLMGRSRSGSPGVHVFTPVRLAGSPRAVLVNRGWVYAPDAATIDLTSWREERTRFSGYTAVAASGQAAAGGSPKGRATRVLSTAAIAALVPYPTEPLYLVARDSGGTGAPVRLPDIELSNGPHLSYAIQWFCFAAIAMVGAGIVARRARAPDRSGSTAA